MEQSGVDGGGESVEEFSKSYDASHRKQCMVVSGEVERRPRVHRCVQEWKSYDKSKPRPTKT